MAAAGQFPWPPAGSYLAVSGQILLALVMQVGVISASEAVALRPLSPEAVVTDTKLGPLGAHGS
jgi:hypothetical protein